MNNIITGTPPRYGKTFYTHRFKKLINEIKEILKRYKFKEPNLKINQYCLGVNGQILITNAPEELTFDNYFNELCPVFEHEGFILYSIELIKPGEIILNFKHQSLECYGMWNK